MDMYESDILKNIKKEQNYINEFKKRKINSKSSAINLLKKQKEIKDLYYIYNYSLSDKLKCDEDIYNYLIDKLLPCEKNVYNKYCRNFIHQYGEACGKTNDKNTIELAIKKINNFVLDKQYDYAYWLFYSLKLSCKIDFNTYYSVYVLFDNNIDIQGYLLKEFMEYDFVKLTDKMIIKLLENTSDECLKINFIDLINKKIFSKEIYYYLLKRGINNDVLIREKEFFYSNKIIKNNIRKKSILKKKKKFPNKIYK